jgi:RHS repeat-associated protein
VSSGAVNYYFADHLGTSRVVTNASGTILDDADFYPFGKERPVTSSSGNNYKFTGKERDAESGLDFFRARFYYAPYGRFPSPDPENAGAKPEDPQSWNAYTYARNNPLLFIDPDGLAYKVSIRGANVLARTYEDLVNLAAGYGAILVGTRDRGQLVAYGQDMTAQVIGSYEWYLSDEEKIQLLKESGERAEEEISQVVEAIWQEFKEDVALAFAPPLGIYLKAKKVARVVKILAKAESPAWKRLKRYRGAIKTSAEGRDQLFFKWDHMKGHIEVYDRHGKHVGVMNPETGVIDRAKAVPGRNIKDELR